MLACGVVSWSSKKHSVVPLSTTEVEFTTVAHCVYQGVWLKRILEYLSMKQRKCLAVYCDNSSTIKLSKNPILHGRIKHIDIKFQFLRNHSKEGNIELLYYRTQD